MADLRGSPVNRQILARDKRESIYNKFIIRILKWQKINQQKQESQLQVEEMVVLLNGSNHTHGSPLTEKITETIGKSVSTSVSW